VWWGRGLAYYSLEMVFSYVLKMASTQFQYVVACGL